MIDQSTDALLLTHVVAGAQGDIIKCIDGRKVKEWSVEKCYLRLQGATCENDVLHASNAENDEACEQRLGPELGLLCPQC